MPDSPVDHRLRREYDQWLAMGMPEKMPATPYIVTIRWPGDEDRGDETYGPFPNERIADLWVADCEEAASLGWQLLQDAEYVISPLPKPFDPHDLMSDAGSFKAAEALTPAAMQGPVILGTNWYNSFDRVAPLVDAAREAQALNAPEQILTDPVTAGPTPYAPAGGHPAGGIELLSGHDYELTYRIEGVHRADHSARMGFLGMDHGMLTFTARPSSGTQQMRPEWISAATDVGVSSQVDITRRYVDRPARSRR